MVYKMLSKLRTRTTKYRCCRLTCQCGKVVIICTFQLLPRTLESVVALSDCFDVNVCDGTDGVFSLFDMP